MSANLEEIEENHNGSEEDDLPTNDLLDLVVQGNADEDQELSRRRAKTLAEIWMHCRSGNETAIHMEILKSQPHLASEYHKHVDSGKYVVLHLCPLHMLIVAKAPLKMIQEVYAMYNTAIIQEFCYYGFRGLSLEFICKNYGTCRYDILDFVCRSCHELGAKHASNIAGLAPIHCAMETKQYLDKYTSQEKRPTLEMFQILLKYGGCAVSDRDAHAQYGMTPLEWSLFMEYSADIQEYLVKLYLQSSDEARGNYFRLDISLGDDQSFDRRTVDLVSRVLPCNRKMDVICSKKLCLEGFVSLCCHLSANASILELKLLKLSTEYISYFRDAWGALQSFLATNETVKDLTLTARRHVYDADRPETNENHFFRSIINGLITNHSLKCLTLKNMEFPDSRSLSAFLSQEISLRSLCLKDVCVDFEWDDNEADPGEDFGSQRLETFKLTLSNVLVHDSFLVGLMPMLSALPALKELSLTITVKQGKKLDLTLYLVTLLERNRLERLDISLKPQFRIQQPATREKDTSLICRYVDFSRLCIEGLNSNTSLCSLRGNLHLADSTTATALLLVTLRQHNATLSNISLETQNTSLEYYLMLNQNGRAVARSPTTTTAEFVNLLCRHRSQCLYSSDSDSDDMTRSFNIDYGLLREIPSTWSAL